eukprot:gene16871-21512_t
MTAAQRLKAVQSVKGYEQDFLVLAAHRSGSPVTPDHVPRVASRSPAPIAVMLSPHSLSGYCTLVIAITVAGFAIAQPANPVENHTSCTAEKADVEKRMEVARSKGQMLLRRQLADQLAALQSSCQSLAVDQGHTANIERLEKEVRALRA